MNLDIEDLSGPLGALFTLGRKANFGLSLTCSAFKFSKLNPWPSFTFIVNMKYLKG